MLLIPWLRQDVILGCLLKRWEKLGHFRHESDTKSDDNGNTKAGMSDVIDENTEEI